MLDFIICMIAPLLLFVYIYFLRQKDITLSWVLICLLCMCCGAFGILLMIFVIIANAIMINAGVVVLKRRR